MTTRKIDIDVKFKTPEAAALGFGLLYHAAGFVQSGCRQQLNAGMADEATAENFIAHALRDEQAREAAIGLAGRIMEDSLRSLADGLDLGEPTTLPVDREPAQIVRDGLVELLDARFVPILEQVRTWPMDLLESAAAWILAAHEARRSGQPEPSLPREINTALAQTSQHVILAQQPSDFAPSDEELAMLLGVSADEIKARKEYDRVANLKLGLEAVGRDGTLSFQRREDIGEIVPSTVHAIVDGGESKPIEFVGTFEPAAIAQFTATGNERIRFVVDGVTMWATEVTIERFEIPPTIDADDFTEDDGAIEFYADGEYNTTTVERLRLRIEPRDLQGDEEPDEAGGLYDFTLYADGELHDGCSSLAEVGNSYPNVAPTLDDWKAGRTVPFAVVVTAARKLAGLTEPLSEENP